MPGTFQRMRTRAVARSPSSERSICSAERRAPVGAGRLATRAPPAPFGPLAEERVEGLGGVRPGGAPRDDDGQARSEQNCSKEDDGELAVAPPAGTRRGD